MTYYVREDVIHLMDVFIPRLMCFRLRLMEIITVRSFSPI